MANIVISELRPVGAELFDGSESFMHELTDDELNLAKGGTSITVGYLVTVITATIAVTAIKLQ